MIKYRGYFSDIEIDPKLKREEIFLKKKNVPLGQFS